MVARQRYYEERAPERFVSVWSSPTSIQSSSRRATAVFTLVVRRTCNHSVTAADRPRGNSPMTHVKMPRECTPIHSRPSPYTQNALENGVPEGNRTPDPRFRKPVLYPAELPGRMRYDAGGA